MTFCLWQCFIWSEHYIVEKYPRQGSKGRLQAMSLDPQRVQQFSSLWSWLWWWLDYDDGEILTLPDLKLLTTIHKREGGANTHTNTELSCDICHYKQHLCKFYILENMPVKNIWQIQSSQHQFSLTDIAPSRNYNIGCSELSHHVHVLGNQPLLLHSTQNHPPLVPGFRQNQSS